MSVTFQTTTLATPPSGTVVDTGSGASGSGTQRVILASDQAALPVTDNGGSLTVDGTIAATQGGTWNVRLQDTSGNGLTSALKGAQQALSVQIVDGSGAQVTTFGGSGGTASNFGSSFPTQGTAIGAKDSTGANMAALNLDASGFLKVNVAAGGGSGGTSSSFGSADPATGTAVGFSDGTNMREARVFDVDTGAGTQFVLGAVLRKSAGGGSVEAGTSTDPIRVDPTGTTTQPVSGTVSVNTHDVANITTSVTPGTGAANLGKAEDAPHTSGDVGVLALAVRQDTLANSTSTDGDYGALKLTTAGRLYTSATVDAALPAGTNSIGTVGLDNTGTGYSITRTLAAASTNATSVKASAGRVHGWYLFNTSAATKFFKLYNKASAPTVGSDTPVMTIPIPAGAGANVEFVKGITFGTGIAFALTGAVGDADTTALAANDVVLNLFWI